MDNKVIYCMELTIAWFMMNLVVNVIITLDKTRVIINKLEWYTILIIERKNKINLFIVK